MTLLTPNHKWEEELLSVKNVSLKLGNGNKQKLILRDINVTVRNLVQPGGPTRGQVIGFLGPSGRGKTQLLRVLAGLQKPTTGEVKVRFNDQMVPVDPGQVGVVSQKYPLLRNRTVLGNLLLAAKMKGIGPAEAQHKALHLLEEFGLEDKTENYPIELSGGQRQRVAIIQQMLCSDFYWLFDEPVSGLDPIAKNKACRMIRAVADMDERNTVVFVTHDVRSAVAISDMIWLLGFEHHPETGDPIPGSIIRETYDLVQMGLAWHPELMQTREFSDFCNELEYVKFRDL